MISTRVIPCLLLNGSGFVKTRKFSKPVYLGDPINILKIFNEKEADEITILDIGATRRRSGPNFELLEEMATECFMPLGYGGGISKADEMARLFQLGFEKAVINTAALENPSLIEQGAQRFGSQSIVVCLDVKKPVFGEHKVYVRNGQKSTGLGPAAAAKRVEAAGAGEVIVNSIDRDGTMRGYDIAALQAVQAAISIPVVALGGAGQIEHLEQAVAEADVSAVAAGSMFVFQGRHRAVLVNMPDRQKLERILGAASAASANEAQV